MQPSHHPVRRMRALFGALLTTLVALAALLTGATASQADTTICEEFGSTTIQGRYVVQNNRWGTTATQCISVTNSGFRITQADGSVPTNGAPKSYPSVYNGCHYTNCSPGTNLPAQLSSISSAPSGISYSYVSGAAYDIWLDPTPRTDGVNRTEIMIWFNRVGSVQPVGSPVGSATVGGRHWQVWSGNNGGNDVLSFVAPSAIDSWNFDVMDFARQAVSRGLAQNNWYLTSVQAGFEPWQNGAGLAVNSFSSTVNLGGGTPGGPGTPSGPAACKVAYGTSVWQDGFHRRRRRDQHGFLPDRRLEGRLHAAVGAADHQRLDRHRVPGIGGRDRHQRPAQRVDRTGRTGLVRVPGHLRRRLRQAGRLQRQRNVLHPRVTHRRTPASGARPTARRAPGRAPLPSSRNPSPNPSSGARPAVCSHRPG